MRIAVVGGGPGGLYFAALTRQLGPGHEITVWERNAPDDTFGFGVVFSDETLGGIEHADPGIYRAMEREFARWDDIDVHFKGETITSGGHGFAAMSRRAAAGDPAAALCRPRRAAALPHRGAGREPAGRDYDLVIAADGANSAVRAQFADAFRPDAEIRHCKYMWLGTDLVFDAFKFYIEQTPHGVMQIHGYPYDATGSTFIVEMHDSVWRAAGFGRLAAAGPAPGRIRRGVHRADPGDVRADPGRPRGARQQLKWISFGTLRCQSWRHDNVILLGDAAHTAHFSIGSGTKLAMEDALALAACLHEQPSLDERAGRLRGRAPAGGRFGAAGGAGQPGVVREPGPVRRTRSPSSSRSTSSPAAAGSPTGTCSCGTRSSWPGWMPGSPATRSGAAWPPATCGRRCSSRCGCAASSWPTGSWSRPWTCTRPPTACRRDFHLVHLGGKALGGAGLVMTEMVCVSAGGEDLARGAPGMYTAGQEAAWRRIVSFVHELVGGQDRASARAFGPQGIDEAHVGGDRPAAGVGQLAGVRALAAAVPARREPGARGAVAGRPGVDPGAVRGRHRGGGAMRLRPGRVALRARVPAVVVHLAAHQSAVRRVRRVTGRAGCASRSRCSRRCARCGRPASR